MKGNEFLDKMELVDAAFIEDADKLPAKKKPVWVKWGAVAACVCLVAVGVFGAMGGGLFGTPDEVPPVVPGAEEAEAFGFTLSDNDRQFTSRLVLRSVAPTVLSIQMRLV